jgi:hypothetical protein
MPPVRGYKDLQTSIDELYNIIKGELREQKELRMLSEIKAEMNGRPLRSIDPVNKYPIVLAGTLREITGLYHG